MTRVGLLAFVIATCVATSSLAQAADPPPVEAPPAEAAGSDPPPTGPAVAEGQPAEATADDARARELYVQGDRLYAEGDYSAAIEAFRESYELSGRPLMLFNLANAYERAGRYQEAADALRSYEPQAPPEERDTILRRVLRLQSRADTAAADPATATSAPAPASNAATVRTDPAATEPRDDTLAWVLAGSGAGLVILGGLAASVASSARLDAEDRCVGGVCPDGARDAVDRDETYSLLADVGFAVGGGALAMGIVLLLLPDAEPVEHARIRLAPGHIALGYGAAF